MQSSPSTMLYQLGRGKLYIGQWSDDTTPPVSLSAVGNAPAFNVEVMKETLEHKNSMEGLNETDAEVTIERGYTCSFTLDEMSFSNLMLFLDGTQYNNVIRALTQENVYHEIKFVADNPGMNSGGEKYKVWHFWKAKIKSNGAKSLIKGNEFLSMQFTAIGQTDRSNHANSPFFDVTFGTSTTTSTTTTTTTTV